MRHATSRPIVRLALIAGALLPAVAGAQGVQPHIPLRTTLAEIAATRSAYADAFNAKDAAKVSEMYTADAIEVEQDGSVVSGAVAIGKANAAAAASWPHIVILSSTVKVYGTWAIDVGTVTSHPKDGKETVNRYIVVLRHGMNGWKLQNIASVPMAK